jgi:hypothetical protein
MQFEMLVSGISFSRLSALPKRENFFPIHQSCNQAGSAAATIASLMVFALLFG